jgi:hypothetical protein
MKLLRTILIFILGVLILIAIILNTNELEINNYALNYLLKIGFAIWIILLLLIISLVRTMRAENSNLVKNSRYGLSSFILLISIIVWFFFSSLSTVLLTDYNNELYYQIESGTDSYIIIQSYLPWDYYQWRCIETNEPNLLFRSYNELDGLNLIEVFGVFGDPIYIQPHEEVEWNETKYILIKTIR